MLRVGLQDHRAILDPGKVAQIGGFSASDRAPLRAGLPHVLAKVGHILLDSIIPENDVLRIQMMRLNRVVVGDHIGERVLPVQPVRGREYLELAVELWRIGHQLEPLRRRSLRVQENHQSMHALLHASNAPAQHQVGRRIRAAAGISSRQLQIRPFPVNPIARPRIEYGPPGRVPKMINACIVQHRMITAQSHPRLRNNKPVAGLLRRMHDELDALALLHKPVIHQELPAAGDRQRLLGCQG